MHSFYTNENFPFQTVRSLRNFGYDVLTSLEAGKANQSVPDEEVLAFAVQTQRILLTLNRRDFLRLHKLSSEHFGIIVCTSDPDTKRQAEFIHKAVTNETDLKSKLIRIYQTMNF